MALSRNIRYLRKKQGWGQDTLAEKLGYKSYTTIQKWESGVSDPPLKVVHELANLFNVAINDLTNGDLDAGDFMNSRKAPTPVTEDGREAEAKRLFEALSDEGKASALNYLRYLAMNSDNQ